MATQRDLVEFGPFFIRLDLLRTFDRTLEEAEAFRGGTIQDTAIELEKRATDGHDTQDAAEALNDLAFEASTMHVMMRLCQIVLLYSTFEALWKGKLASSNLRPVDRTQVDKTLKETAVKRRDNEGKTEKNQTKFLIALIDAANPNTDRDELRKVRNGIESFIILRNHLVHEGLEVTSKLKDDLTPFIESIDGLRGATQSEKIASLGREHELVSIPRDYVTFLFDTVKRLALELIVPVDSELPLSGFDYDEFAKLFRPAKD